MQIFTHANLLISQNAVDDDEQSYVLKEFARFLAHKSTGIKGYEQMPSGWPELVSKIRSNRSTRKSDSEVVEVALGWMQEEKELAFKLSQKTSYECAVRRSKAVSNNADAIRDSHISGLVNEGRLATSLYVPNTASPIDVTLNIESRSYSISMSIRAPLDRTRPTASFNWLIRQLAKTKSDSYLIFARWAGRTPNTDATLKELRLDPAAAVSETASGVPSGFTVCMNRSIQGKFESRKSIITAIENDLQDYYSDVGQYLSSWLPSAPKSRDKTAVEEIVERSNVSGGSNDGDHYNEALE